MALACGVGTARRLLASVRGAGLWRGRMVGREVVKPTGPQAHNKAPCGVGGNVVYCSPQQVAPE